MKDSVKRAIRRLCRIPDDVPADEARLRAELDLYLKKDPKLRQLFEDVIGNVEVINYIINMKE